MPKLLPDTRPSWLRHLTTLRSDQRLASGILISLVAGLLLPSTLSQRIRLVAAWDVFAAVTLLLVWLAILTSPPDQIRRTARTVDSSRVVTLALVIMGGLAALLAVGMLLHEGHHKPSSTRLPYAVLALTAVALAWALTHTVFTLRYAHLYYGDPDPEHGLDFPGHPQNPDYLDFAYFAFTVGMTAQTADVSVSDSRFRRLVLLHAVLSFLFNTALVALSISALGGIL